jgi:hypothetical protein
VIWCRLLDTQYCVKRRWLMQIVREMKLWFVIVMCIAFLTSCISAAAFCYLV